MRKLFVGLVLCISSLASAQVQTPPLRVYGNGTLAPLRFRLNLVDASCVDNPTSHRTDCTTSGTFAGSLALNQIAYGSGANAIQGSSSFLFDGSTMTLGHMTLGTNGTIMADATLAGTTGTFFTNNDAANPGAVATFRPSASATAVWNMCLQSSAAYSSAQTCLQQLDTTLVMYTPNSGGFKVAGIGGLTNLSLPFFNTLGTGQVIGASLPNGTAAALGAQQYSPMLALQGNAFETTGSTSQAVTWGAQTKTIQGTTATGDLCFYEDINGGGFGEKFCVANGGIPKWSNSSNTQTTVGAAGGASALPAAPAKYLKVVSSDGTTLVIPAYNP